MQRVGEGEGLVEGVGEGSGELRRVSGGRGGDSGGFGRRDGEAGLEWDAEQQQHGGWRDGRVRGAGGLRYGGLRARGDVGEDVDACSGAEGFRRACGLRGGRRRVHGEFVDGLEDWILVELR